MFNWLKKFFGSTEKSETKTFQGSVEKVESIVSESLEVEFKKWLATSVKNGKLKDYQCIQKYLKPTAGYGFSAVTEFPLSELDLPNDSIQAFIDKFSLLKCKTDDTKFIEYLDRFAQYRNKKVS